MGKLDGKVAIISGGARGQGAAEVRLFTQEGAKVVFGDVLDEEGLKVESEVQEQEATPPTSTWTLRTRRTGGLRSEPQRKGLAGWTSSSTTPVSSLPERLSRIRPARSGIG